MTRPRMLELRTYLIAEGRRDEFGRRMAAVIPMLRRNGIDVVGHGPSIEDDRHYVLLRSFGTLDELREQEDGFYGSDAWRTGPCEGILEHIEAYHTVVLRSTDEAVRALAASVADGSPPPSAAGFGAAEDDVAVITDLNERFVDAFRKGSWALLEPILSPDFSYLDGSTGEVWSL